MGAEESVFVVVAAVVDVVVDMAVKDRTLSAANSASVTACADRRRPSIKIHWSGGHAFRPSHCCPESCLIFSGPWIVLKKDKLEQNVVNFGGNLSKIHTTVIFVKMPDRLTNNFVLSYLFA